MAHSPVVRLSAFIVGACITASCAHPVLAARTTGPGPRPDAPLLELWADPTDIATRDLRWGPGRPDHAPAADVTYTVVGFDTSGYSRGYDVVAPDGRKWDVKIGEEVQPEIAVSRILWALGYNQPETYYLTGWELAGSFTSEGEPARFRLKSDHETEGEWAWRTNPFSGTRPLHALVAINLVMSNFDFKTSNNRIYRLLSPSAEPSRRYVVQDLGFALGKPRVLPWRATRNRIDDFEATRLIKSVKGSRVALDFRGLHGDALEDMSIPDLIWACELMNRLSDAQLDEAFQAAGYERDIRDRFVRKIRAKIREGLDLRSTLSASSGERR